MLLDRRAQGMSTLIAPVALYSSTLSVRSTGSIQNTGWYRRAFGGNLSQVLYRHVAGALQLDSGWSFYRKYGVAM